MFQCPRPGDVGRPHGTAAHRAISNVLDDPLRPELQLAGKGGDHGGIDIHPDDATARSLAQSDILAERPESVASGRDLPAIAADPERVWSSNRNGGEDKEGKKAAAKAKRPRKTRPMPEAVEPQPWMAELIGTLADDESA